MTGWRTCGIAKGRRGGLLFHVGVGGVVMILAIICDFFLDLAAGRASWLSFAASRSTWHDVTLVCNLCSEDIDASYQGEREDVGHMQMLLFTEQVRRWLGLGTSFQRSEFQIATSVHHQHRATPLPSPSPSSTSTTSVSSIASLSLS